MKKTILAFILVGLTITIQAQPTAAEWKIYKPRIDSLVSALKSMAVWDIKAFNIVNGIATPKATVDSTIKKRVDSVSTATKLNKISLDSGIVAGKITQKANDDRDAALNGRVTVIENNIPEINGLIENANTLASDAERIAQSLSLWSDRVNTLFKTLGLTLTNFK